MCNDKDGGIYWKLVTVLYHTFANYVLTVHYTESNGNFFKGKSAHCALVFSHMQMLQLPYQTCLSALLLPYQTFLCVLSTSGVAVALTFMGSMMWMNAAANELVSAAILLLILDKHLCPANTVSPT
jgi:hypothetical protein